MYKLQFTLKQHTPLIHFQHKQEGATLRATEVKPKLDKYILKQLSEGNCEAGKIKAKENNWLIGDGSQPALNYKIKILPLGSPSITQHRVITENLQAVFYEQSEIFIYTDIKTLSEEITNTIDSFFSVTNFGRRASKGFGSYTLKETTLDAFKRAIRNYSHNNLYSHHNQNTNNWDDLIKTGWGRLKSGRNRPYEKSRIFKYSSIKRQRWEKRWMKLGILDEINNDQSLPNLLYTRDPLDCSNDESRETYNGVMDNTDLEMDNDHDYDYYFYRALLGLPELYEFRAERDHIYQFKISNETIGRFKSPVTFKVFENNVFAFPEYFAPEILGKKFQLDLILKTNTGRIIKEFNCSDGRFDIATPSNFNLLTFLNSYFGSVGFNQI